MLKWVLVAMAFFISPNVAFAGSDSLTVAEGVALADSASGEVKEEGSFSPTDLIFSHVSDAYDWHLFTVGDTHVSIPLPVILYSLSLIHISEPTRRPG